MAVITLTFTDSEEEIVDGIPLNVSISSNIPSTVHYTLDGSAPDENSPIYVGSIMMPYGVSSLSLSAFAIDSDGYSSDIFTKLYSTDTSKINLARRIYPEGITVNYDFQGPDYVVGYDADQNASVFIDKPLADLEAVKSSRGRLGFSGGTVIEIGSVVAEETAYPYDDQFDLHSTPENAEFFNPRALVVVIDNRVDNDIRIINRPYGSLRDDARNMRGLRLNNRANATYISGGFIRRFYSKKDNTMVSYYFDHNTTRWVKGIQELPEIPRVFGSNSLQVRPFVFQWLPWGRHSTIPV